MDFRQLVTSVLEQHPNLTPIIAGLWMIYREHRKAFIPLIPRKTTPIELQIVETLFKEVVVKVKISDRETAYIDRRYVTEVVTALKNRVANHQQVGGYFGYLCATAEFRALKGGLIHSVLDANNKQYPLFGEKLFADIPKDYVAIYVDKIQVTLREIGLRYIYMLD